MCGIAGFFDFSSRSSQEILRSMTDCLAHRGPDDSGYFSDASNAVQIGLGHRRLSIIDVTSGGHQPMKYENLTIVFNGEIYNYREIRRELEGLGYSFDSNSDTEVMLRAFHRWGMGAVHKFIGMFAFALVDQGEKMAYLVRDRAGVKPMYYYHEGGVLLFASELKAFHEHPQFKREMNMDALSQYFLYGYILSPQTIFKNAHKLRPGHYLEINLASRSVKEIEYWDLAHHFRKPKLKISDQDAIDETERLLKSAFEYRLVSDVPVGIFLSGGYDSSTVAAILQANHTDKLKTFTIGFDMPGFNEAEYAKSIAAYLGTDHHEMYCTEKQAEEIVAQIPFYFDEPFGDSSAIPTILVSRIARQKVTVALSADGGDEQFGGYNKHLSTLRALRRLSWVPSLLRKPVGSMLNLVPPGYIPLLNKQYRYEHFYYSASDLLRQGVLPQQILRLASHHVNTRDIKELFKASVKEPISNFDHRGDYYHDILDPALEVDYKTYMVDDILAKVDRATMSVSLEGREPFLDHRIAEFVSQLPLHLKIRDGQKKYLLKQIAHKYIPRKMMDRPKMGFGIPVEYWFRKDLKDIFEHYLNDERIERQGMFDVEYLRRIKKRYYSGINEGFEFIWSMIVFQMWYDRWMS
jgi:asparagine synthase (glutamine-hydrolysing)